MFSYSSYSVTRVYIIYGLTKCLHQHILSCWIIIHTIFCENRTRIMKYIASIFQLNIIYTIFLSDNVMQFQARYHYFKTDAQECNGDMDM